MEAWRLANLPSASTLDHALSIFQALEGEIGIAAVMGAQQFQPNGGWVAHAEDPQARNVQQPWTSWPFDH